MEQRGIGRARKGENERGEKGKEGVCKGRNGNREGGKKW